MKIGDVVYIKPSAVTWEREMNTGFDSPDNISFAGQYFAIDYDFTQNDENMSHYAFRIDDHDVAIRPLYIEKLNAKNVKNVPKHLILDLIAQFRLTVIDKGDSVYVYRDGYTTGYEEDYSIHRTRTQAVKAGILKYLEMIL